MDVGSVIAVFSIVINCIFLYLKVKENKPDIRITISKIKNDDPLSDEAPMYTILARNFGKRSGYIDSVRLKLQCEGKEYTFRYLKTFKDGLVGDISIPCELLPDRKLETSVDFWEIYKFVQDKHESKENGDPYDQNFDLDLKKLSLCKLIADLEDQLGKIHQSDPIDI